MIRTILAFGLTALALFGAALTFGAASAETRLVMFERDGCTWCRRWQHEIGGIYPLTEEGRAAPLVVINVDRPMPDGYSFAGQAVYTPTFVLVEDGVEIARITGYPGEEFFWGLLDQMLADHRGGDTRS